MFAFSQLERFDKSFSIHFDKICNEECDCDYTSIIQKMVAFEIFHRSFMYIMKCRGPNTDPCGTPAEFRVDT